MNSDQITLFLIGIGAIIVTILVGTWSTNRRMEEGFASVNQRIDDTAQRIEKTNQRIDDLQSDVRELRTLFIETIVESAPGED